MRKTLVNIFYNAIYQIFLVLVPLITVPYITRTLGPARYGIYSTVNFTIQFLMVFCAVAMGQIGTRTVARIRAKEDTQALTKSFWGLWYIQAIASVIVMLLTVLYINLFDVQYGFYFYMQLPFLVSAMFDISWFFQGLAEFGKVVLRNTLVKIASVFLILTIVKSPHDLWKYMLIMSVSTMIGSLVFWLNLRDYVGRPVKSFYKLRTTLISVGTLLIPQLATQVYTSLDKPILNAFSNSTQVAFYDTSQRISTMILGVITSITIVMMPKMASSGKASQHVYLKKSYETTLFLGLIFAIVIMVNTWQFVPFFFDEKYLPMRPLMFVASLSILLIPVGGVFANQFALANRRDKDYAIPVVIGAVISLTLSSFLDPRLGAAGAMITVLTVESIVCLLRIWIVRDAYDAKYVFAETPKYFFIALVAFGIGMVLPNIIPSAFFNMVYKSLVVMGIYVLMFFMLKFELAKDYLRLIKRILKRTK